MEGEEDIQLIDFQKAKKKKAKKTKKVKKAKADVAAEESKEGGPDGKARKYKTELAPRFGFAVFSVTLNVLF